MEVFLCFELLITEVLLVEKLKTEGCQRSLIKQNKPNKIRSTRLLRSNLLTIGRFES